MKFLRWLVPLFWLAAPGSYSQTSGNEVSVGIDLSVTIPVVGIGDTRYSAVLMQVPAGSTATWKVAAITQITGSDPGFVSAIFAAKVLHIPCLVYRDKRYSATLNHIPGADGPTFTLASLLPNIGCSVSSGSPPSSALPFQSTCDDETFIYATNSIGLPLLQSRPQAKVSLYLDFTGGTFMNQPIGIYDREGYPSLFSSYEQRDVVCAWKRMTEYFAMFDVNVTTDVSAKESSVASAWLLIGGPFQMDFGTGSGLTSGIAYINVLGAQTFVQGWISSQNGASHEDGSVMAHELGHILGLQHQGDYENGNFVAAGTSFVNGDPVNGAIMGGGFQPFNFWRLGHHKGAGGDTTFQDDIETMRKSISNWSNSDGWHPDDFDYQRSTNTPLLFGSKQGVIEKPGDKDTFAVVFKGGDLSISAKSRRVSTADLALTVYDAFNNVLAGPYNTTRLGREVITVPNLPAGIYFAEVSSTAIDSPYNSSRRNVLGAYTTEVITHDFERLSDLYFTDVNMASCVDDAIWNNGYVMVEELTELNCSGKDISSAQGIEQLTALKVIYLRDNNLSELDVSKNAQLEVLMAENNFLTSIDVTNNTALTGLYVDDNQLSGIDVTKNSALEGLSAQNNFLKEIFLGNNSSLSYLNLAENELGALDVSKNPTLAVLQLNKNSIQQLSLSNVYNLQVLELRNNALTTLDLRNNYRVKEADLAGNELRELSLPLSAAIQRLDVSDNRLSQSAIQLLQQRNIPTLIVGAQR